jgi:hypothetical protein
MNLSMRCSWGICFLRGLGRTFPGSNRGLRFIFSDDFAYESASSRGHRALGFCSFWWGFWFLRFFLLSHIHSHEILSTYMTSMHQLKVGIGTSILLVAYVSSYLPFSIPHPPETQPMLSLTFSPEMVPKCWALKMS